MCNCIYERGKCKSNIDLFKEELFADVVFRFCWENESIFAHPLQDVSRYCKMNIHELLDQRAYSGASRHPIPIQVATQFRLIPPWESDPFRHPLEEGEEDAG